jgi:hypothetical protein
VLDHVLTILHCQSLQAAGPVSRLELRLQDGDLTMAAYDVQGAAILPKIDQPAWCTPVVQDQDPLPGHIVPCG